METMVKVGSLAILAAILCLVLKQGEKPLSLVLSVLACTAVLALALRFIRPVWEILEHLNRLSGLDTEVTGALLKVVGIGMLTQIAACVCVDAGENSLAKAVELSGTVLSVYVSLPLLSAVLTLVEKLMDWIAVKLGVETFLVLVISLPLLSSRYRS